MTDLFDNVCPRCGAVPDSGQRLEDGEAVAFFSCDGCGHSAEWPAENPRVSA